MKEHIRRKYLLFCFVLFTSLVNSIVMPYHLDRDAKSFSENMQDFLDKSLKHDKMQAHLDKLRFKQERLDGKAMLDSLVEKFSQTFAKRITVAKRLRDAVEKSYTDSAQGHSRCCDFSNPVQFDKRFKVSVSFDKACDLISPISPYYSFRLEKGFQQAAIRNFREVPSILWQYFGSEEGVTTVYPAMPACTCGQYDCLSRPWYTQTTERKPKQVVVILDSGESMGAQYWGLHPLALAKEAAILLIQALNPHDQFAVLLTTEEATAASQLHNTADTCFLSKFSLATPMNKRNAAIFLENVKALGDTTYFKPLDEAFDFFQTSIENNRKLRDNLVERIIHLISDGISNDPQYFLMEEIINWNKHLNNSVKIVTYAIGSGDMKTLNDISNFNPEKFKGEEVVRISDIKEMKQHIANTHRSFARAEMRSNVPRWTVPFKDKWGLGQIMTVSLPVYIKKQLKGVVAVDTSLAELFARTTAFKPNELSYSFVIDERGLAINHPLFRYTDNHEMTFMPVTTFERDNEFLKILQSMLRGECGRGSFISTTYQSMGSSKKYGVKTSHVVSTYYWKKIPNTMFSVCVVSIGESQRILMPQEPLPRGSVLYDRFDLLRPTKGCRHFQNYATMDNSSVFIASRAFADPRHYFEHDFSRSDVESIIRYLEGDGPNIYRIKEEIKDEVAATNAAQNLWAEVDTGSAVRNNVIWRYLATRNGLFRILPAIQMPREFDPTTRPWFENSLARRNRGSTVSPPYKDEASEIPVITITKVLYKGSWAGVHYPGTDEVFGVMGVDLQVSYFKKIFMQWFPSCKYSDLYRCYLIDKAGYIIVGNNINERKRGNAKHRITYDAHMIEFEPEIASVLIREDVLRRSNCSNTENGMFHQSYTISESQSEFWGTFVNNLDESFDFELIPIPDTNMFVLMRILTEFETSAAVLVCPCQEELCTVISNEQETCECPCTDMNPFFDSCRNEYLKSSFTPPPCIPVRDTVEPEAKKLQDLSSLAKCYNTSYVSVEKYSRKWPLDTTPASIVVAVLACLIVCSLFCQKARNVHLFRNKSAEAQKKIKFKCATRQTKSDQTFLQKKYHGVLRQTKSDYGLSTIKREPLSACTLRDLLKKNPSDHSQQPQCHFSPQILPWRASFCPFAANKTATDADFVRKQSIFPRPASMRKTKSDEDVYKIQNQLCSHPPDLDSSLQKFQGLPSPQNNEPTTQMLHDFLRQTKTEQGFPTLPPQEFLRQLRQVKTDSDIPKKFETTSNLTAKELLNRLEKLGSNRCSQRYSQNQLKDPRQRTSLPTYLTKPSNKSLKQLKQANTDIGSLNNRDVKLINHVNDDVQNIKVQSIQIEHKLPHKEQNIPKLTKTEPALLDQSEWSLLKPIRKTNTTANFCVKKNVSFSHNQLAENLIKKINETKKQKEPFFPPDSKKESRENFLLTTSDIFKKPIDFQEKIDDANQNTNIQRNVKLAETDTRLNKSSRRDTAEKVKKTNTHAAFPTKYDFSVSNKLFHANNSPASNNENKKAQDSSKTHIQDIIKKIKQAKASSEHSVRESYIPPRRIKTDSGITHHRDLALSGQLAKELLDKLKKLNFDKNANGSDVTKLKDVSTTKQKEDSSLLKKAKTSPLLQFPREVDKEPKKAITSPSVSMPHYNDFSKELFEAVRKKKEKASSNSLFTQSSEPLIKDSSITKLSNVSVDDASSIIQLSPARFSSALLHELQETKKEESFVSNLKERLFSNERTNTNQLDHHMPFQKYRDISTGQQQPGMSSRAVFQSSPINLVDEKGFPSYKSNSNMTQSQFSNQVFVTSSDNLRSKSSQISSSNSVHLKQSSSQLQDERSAKNMDKSNQSSLELLSKGKSSDKVVKNLSAVKSRTSAIYTKVSRNKTLLHSSENVLVNNLENEERPRGLPKFPSTLLNEIRQRRSCEQSVDRYLQKQKKVSSSPYILKSGSDENHPNKSLLHEISKENKSSGMLEKQEKPSQTFSILEESVHSDTIAKKPKALEYKQTSNTESQTGDLIPKTSRSSTNMHTKENLTHRGGSISNTQKTALDSSFSTYSDKGPLASLKKHFSSELYASVCNKDSLIKHSTTQTDESILHQLHEDLSKSNLSSSTISDLSFQSALSTHSNESYSTCPVGSNVSVPDKLYYCQTEDILSVHHYQIKSYHSAGNVNLEQDEKSITQMGRRSSFVQTLHVNDEKNQRTSSPRAIRSSESVSVFVTPKSSVFFSTENLKRTEPQSSKTDYNTAMSSGLSSQPSSMYELSPNKISPLTNFASVKQNSFEQRNKNINLSATQAVDFNSSHPSALQQKQKKSTPVTHDAAIETFETEKKMAFNDQSITVNSKVDSNMNKSSELYVLPPENRSLHEQNAVGNLDKKISMESDVSNLTLSSHESTNDGQVKVPFESQSTMSDYYLPRPFEKYVDLKFSDKGPVIVESNSSVGATTVKKIITSKQSPEAFLENVYLQAAARENTMSPSPLKEDLLASESLIKSYNENRNNFSERFSTPQNSATIMSPNTKEKQNLNQGITTSKEREMFTLKTKENHEKITEYVRECIEDAVERAMLQINKLHFSSNEKDSFVTQSNASLESYSGGLQFRPFSSREAVRGSRANTADFLNTDLAESSLSHGRNSLILSDSRLNQNGTSSSRQSQTLYKTNAMTNSNLSESPINVQSDNSANVNDGYSIPPAQFPSIHVEIDVGNRDKILSTEAYYNKPGQIEILQNVSPGASQKTFNKNAEDYNGQLNSQSVITNTKSFEIASKTHSSDCATPSSSSDNLSEIYSLRKEVQTPLSTAYEALEDLEITLDKQSMSTAAKQNSRQYIENKSIPSSDADHVDKEATLPKKITGSVNNQNKNIRTLPSLPFSTPTDSGTSRNITEDFTQSLTALGRRKDSHQQKSENENIKSSVAYEVSRNITPPTSKADSRYNLNKTIRSLTSPPFSATKDSGLSIKSTKEFKQSLTAAGKEKDRLIDISRDSLHADKKITPLSNLAASRNKLNKVDKSFSSSPLPSPQNSKTTTKIAKMQMGSAGHMIPFNPSSSKSNILSNGELNSLSSNRLIQSKAVYSGLTLNGSPAHSYQSLSGSSSPRLLSSLTPPKQSMTNQNQDNDYSGLAMSTSTRGIFNGTKLSSQTNEIKLSQDNLNSKKGSLTGTRTTTRESLKNAPETRSKNVGEFNQNITKSTLMQANKKFSSKSEISPLIKQNFHSINAFKSDPGIKNITYARMPSDSNDNNRLPTQYIPPFRRNGSSLTKSEVKISDELIQRGVSNLVKESDGNLESTFSGPKTSLTNKSSKKDFAVSKDKVTSNSSSISSKIAIPVEMSSVNSNIDSLYQNGKPLESDNNIKKQTSTIIQEVPSETSQNYSVILSADAEPYQNHTDSKINVVQSTKRTVEGEDFQSWFEENKSLKDGEAPFQNKVQSSIPSVNVQESVDTERVEQQEDLNQELNIPNEDIKNSNSLTPTSFWSWSSETSRTLKHRFTSLAGQLNIEDNPETVVISTQPSETEALMIEPQESVKAKGAEEESDDDEESEQERQFSSASVDPANLKEMERKKRKKEEIKLAKSTYATWLWSQQQLITGNPTTPAVPVVEDETYEDSVDPTSFVSKD